MTNHEISSAIDSAALEAAVASFDAHGQPVRPALAWDLVSARWAEGDDQRLGLLPNFMPPEFAQDYYRHAAKLVGDMAANHIRIVDRLYEIYLPMDGGDLSYRTDRLSDAMLFSSRLTEVAH